jgi:hypothetical protein
MYLHILPPERLLYVILGNHHKKLVLDNFDFKEDIPCYAHLIITSVISGFSYSQCCE